MSSSLSSLSSASSAAAAAVTAAAAAVALSESGGSSHPAPPELPCGLHTIRRRGGFSSSGGSSGDGGGVGGGDLEQLRASLARFADERDWDQFHTPRNLALAMVGEVGELAEIFQWKSDASCPPGLAGWKDSQLVHLGEEMADVLLYLVRLADRCGVDLPAAAQRKILINGIKYPPQQVRGRSEKYDEYGQKPPEPAAAAAAATATTTAAATTTTTTAAAAAAAEKV
jgi:dCTP diphosphatase